MATSGFGTLIKRGDGGGPETFTTIAAVKSISGPSMKLDTIDITTLDSTGYRQFIATMKTGGQVQLDMLFLPADATQSYSAGVILDFHNRTLRNFKIVFSDGAATTWTFPAYVTDVAPDASVDAALGLKVTLQISGAPTLA
jgi:predicted secreted protein